MFSNGKILSFILLSVCIFCSPAYAAKSVVKGDPELLWETPLGKGDIENNAYNRCLLIKMVKPGVGQTSKREKNVYDVLSTYVSDLYAQSVKISAYIAAEDENADDSSSSTTDVDNEKAIIEQEITRRLADISRRINIINSFEAGIIVLDSLQGLRDLAPTTYSEFRALQDGRYQYVTDCEVLKK